MNHEEAMAAFRTRLEKLIEKKAEMELPRLITKPTELQVGDIIEGVLIGAGTQRGKLEVTGTFPTDSYDGQWSPNLFCIGVLTEDVKTKYDGTMPKGTATGVWRPDPKHNDVKRDLLAAENGKPVKYLPMLLQRGEVTTAEADVPETDEAAILAKFRQLTGEDLKAESKVLTLQNPDPIRVHGDVSYECYKCESQQARYFYPKVGEMRCPTCRDRSLQSPDDPPHKWETYIAYEFDPMDAKYFADADSAF